MTEMNIAAEVGIGIIRAGPGLDQDHDQDLVHGLVLNQAPAQGLQDRDQVRAQALSQDPDPDLGPILVAQEPQVPKGKRKIMG